MSEKKEETYPKMKSDKFDSRFITVISDDKKIRTLRLTRTEHQRLIERSDKEYLSQGDTLWNRLVLAFSMLF